MAALIPIDPEPANGLALAIVASSNAPLLLLDGNLTVIAASASFCTAFHLSPIEVQGLPLLALGGGEWDRPQLASLLKATAAGHAAIEAYELDLAPQGKPTRRLVLNAQKLDFADSANVHILLSVADVTEARVAQKVKDDLVRDKAVLMQELQHRVANSLQIIASVLMQSARKVQSEETRSHLYDAHHRVMSVAAMQRQLAVTRVGDVALRSYFSDLCDSIGASMIRDHNKVTLDTDVDGSTVGADASVSLGLIVTELVINALKHAFPDARDGKIMVGYHAVGPDWTLSVTDDGVGMSTAPKTAKAGLGTSIVEALSNQLGGKVVVSTSSEGTEVSIVGGAIVPDLPEAA
jgi:two-component sensor histidine kinase